MDIKEEIISALSYLGLEKTEALIYFELLQTRPATVGTVSKKLAIDRGSVYRALTRLKNLGITSTTFSNPVVCRAVKPKNAVQEIIQRKSDEIVAMQKISARIIKNLEQVTRPIDYSEDPSFTIIQGRSSIYSCIARLISQVTNEVYLVTTIEDVLMMYHTSIPEKIKSCIKNGGKIRLLMNRTSDNMSSIIKEFGVTETRIGELPSKSRIVVERGKQLVMSPSAGDSTNMSDMVNVAFVTNSSEMIMDMYSFCGYLWEKSEPLEKFAKESFNARKTGKREYQIAATHRIKELEQEEIILEEIRKFLKERAEESQIYDEDKKHNTIICYRIKELEQERIVLEDLNKLLEKKFKRRPN